MEGVAKLDYARREVVDVEQEVSHPIKVTLTQGLNAGAVLNFTFPADHGRFTDLSSALLVVELQVQRSNGTPITATDHVIFDANGLHSLFTSCEVRFEDRIVSTMTHYPYTSTLSRLLGCAQDSRSYIWDELDGTWNYTSERVRQSSALGETLQPADRRVIRAGEQRCIFVGRVFSDILMTSRQLLPPSISLSVALRRAHDHFSIVCPNDNRKYNVMLHSAAMYIRRLKLHPTLTTNAISAANSGGCITYNRLETRCVAIPQGSEIFRYQNCLNSGPLPNRLYIAFLAQSSLYGQLTQYCTYFEDLNIRELSVKVNGRDIQTEPIEAEFEKDDAGNVRFDAGQHLMGYLSIIEILDQTTNLCSPVRLSHLNWKNGCTIFALELGKCGVKNSAGGALDIEARFGVTEKPGMMVVFCERTESAALELRKV